MSPRKPKPDTETQRRLKLAEAVARERLMELRTAQVLELMGIVKGRLDPTRALEIYARVQGLREGEVRALADRVLASLAQSGEELLDLDALEPPETTPGSGRLLSELRRRLRGRVNTELRHHIELHMGRCQVLLLQLHVEQALRFLQAIPEDWAVADGVELYAQRLGVEDPLPSTLYYFVLDRLAAAELPLPRRKGETPADGATTQPLRVVSGS